MKKLGTIVGMALLYTTLVMANQTQTKELSPQELKKQSNEIVKLSSIELSKSLPQVVDRYTTLTQIRGEESTLLCIFEINTGAKSDETIRKEDKGRMKKAITVGICQSSKKFLDV